jgi:hypothetical protein
MLSFFQQGRQLDQYDLIDHGNSKQAVPIEINRDFDVGNQEDDNEEYQATILAIPEITHGYALSNVRSINLG